MSNRPHSEELSQALRDWADATGGMASDRLELFLLEYREEKQRLFGVIWQAGLVVVAGLMTIFVTTGLAVYLAAPEARPWAAAGFVVLYGLATAWGVGRIRNALEGSQIPFKASLEEFRKDREHLSS